MKYTQPIAVRFLPGEYEKIVGRINRCEGKTFSDRFRTYLRQSVPVENEQ